MSTVSALSRSASCGESRRAHRLWDSVTGSAPTPVAGSPGAGVDLTDKLLERARAALAKLVTEVLGPEAEVERHVVRGHRAAPEIVRFAKEDGVDLIVTSTHGHSGMEQLLYGSTVERVVQLSTVPVLTQRPFGRGFRAAAE